MEKMVKGALEDARQVLKKAECFGTLLYLGLWVQWAFAGPTAFMVLCHRI